MTYTETTASYANNYPGQYLDQITHAWVSQFSGVSYLAYLLSITDWLMHLAVSPGTQINLLNSLSKKLMNNSINYLEQADHSDRRFKADLWHQFPFNCYVNNFLLWEEWCYEVTKVRGVTEHHKLMNQFLVKQIVNLLAPTNFIATNPEVLQATKEQNGMNFIKGLINLGEDVLGIPDKEDEQFKVGKNLGITPGKVVYRNDLMELIQYSPCAQEVYANPVLIIPACIMKYYILDLSVFNSLVKYLVSQGHTVFMISWYNPDAKDRDLVIDDYINQGILQAMQVINDIVPAKPINAVGYCIGGTFLMLAASYLAVKNDNRLNSLTLFAAQTDFTNAGEILTFVDESQISMLEDLMSHRGYLDGKEMANAFAFMNSHDLILGKMIRNYWLGDKTALFDIMAWNADTTRLPYKMHKEYLHDLFLENALVQGEIKINQQGISLANIKLPIFVVGTTTDHVAPWKSVYKLHYFTKSDLTFLLTNGGHNAGIVSRLGHKDRRYQVMSRKKKDNTIPAEVWQQTAPFYDGSWWPEWQKWLIPFSGDKVQPPSMGNKAKKHNVLCDAPGSYVFKK